MKTLVKISAIIALFSIMTACSTWDGMSKSEKGTVIGTGAGAVIGAQISEGKILGTAGGAVAEGLIGGQVGKVL